MDKDMGQESEKIRHRVRRTSSEENNVEHSDRRAFGAHQATIQPETIINN
jgi:hypothetical protein